MLNSYSLASDAERQTLKWRLGNIYLTTDVVPACLSIMVLPSLLDDLQAENLGDFQ